MKSARSTKQLSVEVITPRRKVFAAFSIFFLLITAFVGWRVQVARARAEKLESEILKRLSVEDVQLVIKSQAEADPQAAEVVKANSNASQALIKNLSDILGLAAEARREGLAEDTNFKVNVEYKKNSLLQNLYMAKLFKEQGKAFYVPEEIDAVWDDPANEARFSQDAAALEAIQKVYAASRETSLLNSKPEGKKLEKARREWATTKVFSDKAKADGQFMQRPEVQLRLKIVEAGILAADYLNKHWRADIKATNAEIQAYLAAHPEYDIRKKREKAELVLRRAKAGEDFKKLAEEFSEDRRTKANGGLYENVQQNFLWQQVEESALAIETGQIVDRIVESDTGFHVVKLEGKQITKDKDGRETVRFSLRHVLLQRAFEEPNSSRPDLPPTFLKPEEIAKAEVEKQKYNKLVTSLVARNQISVPDKLPN